MKLRTAKSVAVLQTILIN